MLHLGQETRRAGCQCRREFERDPRPIAERIASQVPHLSFGFALTYGWPVTLPRSDLLGRETEKRAISEFLEPESNAGQVLLLEGEAGIGKTSLWKAAVSAADGFRRLSSAPTEAEAGLPYAVLCDLLDPIPQEAVASLADPLRAALDVALFRAPAKQVPTDQLAVSTAFLRVLRHLAASQEVLLALDDLQWVDAPSLRVLSFALSRLEGEPVRLLSALRVPSPNNAGDTLRRAVGDGRLRRLTLGTLPFSVIDDLLLQRLERPLRRPQLERVYSVSGGNPFFALEIGRFIVEHPTTVRIGEPIPVPQSLADAIKDRIKRLPPESRDILVAMAALARPDEALLRRADPRAGPALRAAHRAQVIESFEGRLRFTHPLLSSVIYSMADPAARRQWHARLADLVGDPEERARHLAHSATAPDAAVADALETASRSANARGAPDAAATLAQQAAELTPREYPRAIQQRRIMSAEYCLRAGDAPAAREILEAVLGDSSTTDRSAEALRMLSSITFASGKLPEAETILVEARDAAGDDLRAQAIIARDLVLVSSQQGKFQAALDHSTRLTELAARTGDPSLVALAQRQKAFTERHFKSLSPEGRAIAVGLAEGTALPAIDDPVGGLHPLMDWAVLLKWSDDFDHARMLFKRALALTDGRDESVRAPILFHLAEMECWSGDWLLAAVYAHECEKSVIHAGQRSYARLSLTANALLHSYRGELREAASDARAALAIAVDIGDEPYHRRALAILGATELCGGDPAAANQHFESLRGRGTDVGFRGTTRSEGDEVEALLSLGRLADAEAVCARLAKFDDPWQRTIGSRSRALLTAARGDLPGSIREFDLALDAHAALPMPLERARTLLAYGAVLRRGKQKRAARERLQEALAILNPLGAAAWIRRAEAELSRVAPSSAGPGTLTPTEARVAGLVASGHTNKEVAAKLSLSVKTVEANLSRIYSKLNVRSRSELVARVGTPG
jgi:DNA-binding CsgD family transcriptional regulator